MAHANPEYAIGLSRDGALTKSDLVEIARQQHFDRQLEIVCMSPALFEIYLDGTAHINNAPNLYTSYIEDEGPAMHGGARVGERFVPPKRRA